MGAWLLLLWAGLAVVMTQVGLPRTQIRMATEAALIPVWFLAVYLLVTAFTPLAQRLWDRLGWGSVALFVPLAMLTDWPSSHGRNILISQNQM